MEATKETILDSPVDSLPLSTSCIENLKKMNYLTLRGFVGAGWKKIRESEGFDYISFNEVIRFLDDRNLLHLMEAHNRV